MTKKELLDRYFEIDPDKLAWEIYLMDFKGAMENNPYSFMRLKFKQDSYVRAYARELMLNMGDEINKKHDIIEYNRENKERDLTLMSLSDDLIKEMYQMLMDALAKPVEEISKVKGYLLVGTDLENPYNNICYGVMGSPIIKAKLDNFSYVQGEDGLKKEDIVMYKLKKRADFILLENNIYSFNYKYEKLFKLGSTMSRLKMLAIDRIIFKGDIANSEEFKKQCISFKGSKAFLNIDEEKLKALNTASGKREIAERFNIELNEDGKLLINSSDDSKAILKHLALRVIKDADTNILYEGSNLKRYNAKGSEEEITQ